MKVWLKFIDRKNEKSRSSWKQFLITANKPVHVGRNGSKTFMKSKIPIRNGLNIKTNDSIEEGLNEFKLKKFLNRSLWLHGFLSSSLYPLFQKKAINIPSYISNTKKRRQNINQKNWNSSNVIFVHFASVFKNWFRIKTHNFHFFITCF